MRYVGRPSPDAARLACSSTAARASVLTGPPPRTSIHSSTAVVPASLAMISSSSTVIGTRPRSRALTALCETPNSSATAACETRCRQ
nr:hypothetical protein [Pimelobacter simplex]